jgi:hypothetical protein
MTAHFPGLVEAFIIKGGGVKLMIKFPSLSKMGEINIYIKKIAETEGRLISLTHLLMTA